jgi:glyoxylase-like metal-dependent hydrolase (beta-lactamase superfamily II)
MPPRLGAAASREEGSEDDRVRAPGGDGLLHEETNGVAYVCADPDTRRCALIGPVLDFDRDALATHTDFADRRLRFVRERGLEVEWILDTHPHADHFSAASDLKERLGGRPIAIGACVVAVQRIWKETCPTSPPTARSGTACSRTASASA